MRTKRTPRRALLLLATVAMLVMGSISTAGAQYGGGTGPVGAPNTVAPGESVTISLGGFRPNSQVTVTIESTPVTLGTFRADSGGNVNATVTIPSSLSVGDHTLKVTGVSPTGASRVVSQDVAVTATGTSPLTGTRAIPLVALGAVLIVLGLTTVLVLRSRRVSVRA